MHKDLKDAITNDNLILFVGAGMSMPLGFPSWTKLILEILDDLEKELGETLDKFNLSYYKSLGNDINVFEVLEDLERCNHKQRVKNILYNKINTVNFASKSLDRHEKLWKISSKIITTNYDKVLEEVKPATVKSFANNNDFQQRKSLQGNPFLYKIHGDIDNPDTCTLFPSDYNELYQIESSANKETLKHFFNGKTILFIGFSLDDPFIKKQLEYIHKLYKGYTNTHFLISKGNKDFAELNIKILSIENWNEAFDEKLDELIALKESCQSTELIIEKEEDSVDISKETDLVKLKNIFDQKKKELADVNELEIKEAFREISKISERIQQLQTKELDFQQSIPNHNQQKLEYIFDEVFSIEKLSSNLIQEIEKIKDQYSEKSEWYHRSVLVSALACSIINSDKLDPKKLNLLIDFTNDSEDKVWQKAITYLFLVLNHLGNKWIRYKGILQPKLKGLQEKSEIQEALKTIIAFMQWGLQDVSITNKKIFENEYFKDSPFNYFLPFYKDNPSVEKVYDDDTIEDIEAYIKFLYKVPLSDAFKYLLCNSEKTTKEGKKEETEEEKIASLKTFTQMLDINHTFEPYLNYVNDFLNFYENYPKSLTEIKQEVTVIKINKLKNLLLNTVEEHRAMARQFTIQEDWGKAITHYELLLEIEAKDESALLNLVRCYDNIDKNVNDKLKLRLQIEELLPEDHENLYEIANLYNIKDNNNSSIKLVKESLKYINKAIDLNDSKAFYYDGRAIIKNKLKDYNGALLDFDRAIELDSSYAEFYHDRGIIKAHLEDFSGALLDYDKVIELDDSIAKYYKSRGNTKYNLEDFSGALLDFDKAIELDDQASDYYKDRGDSKHNLKDYKGALLDYNKAIELDENHTTPYFNKANTLRKLGLFKDAHKFCNIAIELGTEDGRDLGTKATIYASEGKEELFYEYLEKAFQAKARAIWLDDDIQEKYKDEKRFQELLTKYNQTLE